MTLGGRGHYPQDIEATVAAAAPMVRGGYAVAFAAPAEGADRLVIVAERATGTGRKDPAPAIAAIREEVQRVHGVHAADVRFVPAGAIRGPPAESSAAPRAASSTWRARSGCADTAIRWSPAAGW